jgi:hypothetical protein
MSCSGEYMIESGLISQEIYYEVPELRHIVTIDNTDLCGNKILPTELTIEEHKHITNDICYNELNWGDKSPSIKYTELIPYLIKGFQEQHNIINEELGKYSILQRQYDELLSRIISLENNM